MLLIDGLKLSEEIEKSMLENPHKDPKISQNHHSEHRHFLDMLHRQPVVFDTEKVIEQIMKYEERMIPWVLEEVIAIIRKGGVEIALDNLRE